MKFFDKWFAKKCRQAWEMHSSSLEVNISPNSYDLGITQQSQQSKPPINHNGMNMTVHKANGGYVVECHPRYSEAMRDLKGVMGAHHNGSSLHIITEDQDLGAELSKIITYEALRN